MKWLRQQFRNYVLTDFWRKLFALVLALVTWAGLHKHLQQYRTVTVPVEVRHGENIVLLDDSEKMQVQLTLELIGSDFSEYELADCVRDVHVEMPVQREQKGTWTFSVQQLHAECAKGIRISKMQPETVKVDYDTMLEKSVHVTMPADMPLGEKKLMFVKVAPEEVTLHGPSTYLADWHDVSLELFSASDYLQKPFSQYVAKVKNPYHRHVTIRPGKVTVRLREETVVEEKKHSLRKQVTVLSGEKAAGARVLGALPVVEVLLQGTPRQIAELVEHDVFCFVNLSQVPASGEFEFPVLAGGVPTGMKYSLSPERVLLQVEVPAKGEKAGEAPETKEE